MLKLEKLEIRGFKSFAEVTEVHFHQGITAVVGPNGCGKSNILDAISWVLGEQSPKSLRGSKMEDVIFNGTAERKPLGLAEVTLTLMATQDISAPDNETDDIEIKESNINIDNLLANNTLEVEAKKISKKKKNLPTITKGEKITVCRRLYRSGDSDYLMNGHVCRLRDIQDFFAGTGLGGAQYAIIEQGHIGQILSSKPQDRRGLIEEAAGITKFKAKKHLAELKLEATKQNLSRLNDILAEIERQIAVLKKQASKARRYRKLREQIRLYWQYIFINEYKRINGNLTNVVAKLNQNQQTEQNLIIEFTKEETRGHVLQLEVDKSREVLEQIKEHHKELEIESQRTNSSINYQREQEKEIKVRIINSEQEIKNIGEKLVINQQEILKYKIDKEILSEQVNKLEKDLDSQEKIYRSYQKNLIDLEKQLDELQKQQLNEISKTERLKNLHEQLLDNQKRANWQKEQLNSEVGKTEEQLANYEQEFNKLRKKLTQTEDKVETFLTDLEDVEDRLKLEKQTTLQAQKTLDEITRSIARSEDRLGSLKQLDEKQAYFSESVQKLLGDKKIQKQFNLVGTLADILAVKAENETIVEKVLTDILQTILVKQSADAVNAIEWLSKQKGGQASFLVIENKVDSQEKVIVNIDDKRARQLLNLLGLKAEYINLFQLTFPELAKAFVTDNLDIALELSTNNPQYLFFTVNGEKVRAGRLLTTNFNKVSSNVLQLKREIKELNDKLINLESDEITAKSKLNVQQEKVRRLEEEKAEIDSLLRTEEKTLAAQQVEVSQSAKELERNRQQIKAIKIKVTENEQEIIKLAAKVIETIKELQEAEQYKIDIENNLAAKKAVISQVKPEVELANQKLTELKTETAAKQERYRAIKQTLEKLITENQELIQQNEKLKSDLTQLAKRGEELKNNLVLAEKITNNLTKEIQITEKNLAKAETDLTNKSSEITQLEIKIADLRNQISKLREVKASLQVEKARQESDLQHLSQNCLNELSENIVDLINNPASQELNELLESQNDVSSVQQLLVETRDKLLDLGAVNMMALEELAEAEQRQAFLQEQYRDILVAIDATEAALREIKIRSRIKFREAFQKINANFSVMFQELFGGGHGEMSLINEEDILESGIDINAQPPGKRLQNILLLSGGEKAMTALALVLSIFQFRPSPFCVLDEVDAPLDEINIGRFTEKVKHMSDNTQFLVITHSKRTMEMAASIYGVTMQSPGISKLISVRLDTEVIAKNA